MKGKHWNKLIVHCDKGEASEAGGGRLMEREGPSGHAEVGTRRLLTRTQSLQQMLLSFLTQKAMSTMDS